MAALSGITAVKPTADTRLLNGTTYGATVAAGNPLYQDTADSEYKLASNASATLADVKGIAITPGADGEPGYIAVGGSIILVGATTAIGTTYFVGPNPGEIVPEGDITSTKLVSRIGTASNTTGKIKLSLEATGIAHA